MLLNYIKIAWRNLTKDGKYSVINLIGLSLLFGITGISNESAPKGNRNPENNGRKFGKSFTTILHGFYQIDLDSTNLCYTRILVGNRILVRRFLIQREDQFWTFPYSSNSCIESCFDIHWLTNLGSLLYESNQNFTKRIV